MQFRRYHNYVTRILQPLENDCTAVVYTSHKEIFQIIMVTMASIIRGIVLVFENISNVYGIINQTLFSANNVNKKVAEDKAWKIC